MLISVIMPADPVSIQIGGVVSHSAFESILSTRYLPSLKIASGAVEFDLRRLCAIDPFSLSLLYLWICELRAMGKTVSIRFADSEDIFAETDRDVSDLKRRINTLARFSELGFDSHLRRIGVNVDPILSPTHPAYSGEPQDEQVTLFRHLATQTDLEAALQSFDLESTDLEGTSPSSSVGHRRPRFDLDVVRSGEIKNIVLRELGQNIFDHGKGLFGHVIVSASPELQGTRLERENLLLERNNGRLSPENPFFQTLGSTPYVTVIISDKGPGLSKTLGPFFPDKIQKTAKVRRPHPSALIEYAFLRHTTRKSNEERRAFYELLMDKSEIQNLPATGLYWVKQVAKDFRGLLSVRSDGKYVCYDFLNNPRTGRPDSGGVLYQQRLPHKVPLTRFGGVQIRLTFPASIPSRVAQPSRFLADLSSFVGEWTARSDSGSKSGATIRPTVSHISVGPELIARRADSKATLAEWLNKTLTKLDIAFETESKPHVVFLDLCDWNPETPHASKAFYIMMIEVMRRQTPSFAVVVVGAHTELAAIAAKIADLWFSPNELTKERAVVALSLREAQTTSIWGLSKKELGQLDQLLQSSDGGSMLRDLPPGFIRKCDAILHTALSSGRVQLKVSDMDVVGCYESVLRLEIQNHVLEPKNAILHGKGCYLIPSRAYANGYFNLNRLLIDVYWKERVCTWLLIALRRIRPAVLIACGRLLDRLTAILQVHFPSVTIVSLDSARDDLGRVKIEMLKRGQSTAILVDVIGTKRSLNTILSWCTHLPPPEILAVIDARSEPQLDFVDTLSQRYPLTAVVSYPIQFWYEDKPRGYREEEIILVDSTTNEPLPSTMLPEDSLWKVYAEAKNWPWADHLPFPNARPLLRGHFSRREKHLLYLVDTETVALEHSREICEVIIADFNQCRARDTATGPPERIVVYCPAFTNGTVPIAKELALRLDRAQLIPVTEADLASADPDASSLAPRRLAVIFDDACFSGRTARAMIHFAERMGSGPVFLYILCNRADALEAAFLKRIESYGRAKVHVRFLAEVRIPSFQPSQCPVCERRLELDRLRENVVNFPVLRAMLEEEYESFRYTEDVVDEGRGANSSVNVGDLADNALAWRLRLLLERAFRSYPYRRQLVSVVTNYKKDPRSVEVLFSVLACEARGLLKTAPYAEDVFYDTFRQRLLDLCRVYLSNRGTRWETILKDVLIVADALDSEFVFAEWREIAKCCQESGAALKVVILHMMRTALRTDAITRVETVVRDLAATGDIDSVNELGAFLPYLANKSVSSNERLNALRRCISVIADHGRLAGHLSAAAFPVSRYSSSSGLVSLTKERVVEAVKLIQTELFPHVRVLINAEVTERTSHRLRALMTTVRECVDELELRVHAADSLGTDESIIAVKAQITRDEVSRVMRRLQELLIADTDESLINILRDCRCNMWSIVKKYLDDHTAGLEALGVEVVAVEPEDSLFVFGSQMDIFVIVRNIVENVRTRAFPEAAIGPAATRVMEVRASSVDGGRLKLRICDNGVGLGSDFEKGSGLKEVDTLLQRIGSDVLKVQPNSVAGGGTVVEVYLWHVPSKSRKWVKDENYCDR